MFEHIVYKVIGVLSNEPNIRIVNAEKKNVGVLNLFIVLKVVLGLCVKSTGTIAISSP